jgi:hypothetical protein
MTQISSRSLTATLSASLLNYLPLGWVLLALTTIVYIQLPRLDNIKNQQQQASKAQLQQETVEIKQQLSMLKYIPSFGYDNLVADWKYIDLVQYMGDDNRTKVGFEALMDYFDAVLDRDPRFLNAYLMMGGTASIFAGEPKRAVEIANKHLPLLSPKNPDRAYYIWRMKGVEELLFLGRTDDAKKSMLMTAEWTKAYAGDKIESSSEAMNVGKVSAKAAADIDRNPDSRQAKFQAWNMVIDNAVDDRAIQRAVAEIKALGGKVRVNAEGKVEILPPPED